MARPVLRSLSSPTLSDQAYEAILGAITAGELPRGGKVTERGLAEMLGVSPTPIREALQRLVQDRQVERVGPRSLRIATVPEGSIEEVDEVERELRVLSARFAARKADDAAIAGLTELLDEIDAAAEVLAGQLRNGEELDERLVRRVFATSRRFHDEIESIAGNGVLDRVLEHARAFSPGERQRAAERLSHDAVEGVRQRMAEHRELLAAIRDRDEDAAADVMRRHVSSAHRDIRRVL